MTLLSLDRPFGQLVPVAMDTSNVIDLGHETLPEWYITFKEMKNSGEFTFCLSDLTVGELLKAINNKKHNWFSFTMSLERLYPLLDDVLPILPGGVDMEKLCGMDIPRETSEFSLDVIINRSQLLWKKMYEGGRKSDIYHVERIESLKCDFDKLKTRYQKTFISPENTAQELGLDLNNLSKDKAAQREFAEAFRGKFKKYKARDFTVDQVLDLYIQLRIQLFIEFTRNGGYNPMKKKDNHSFDLLLFEVLPLPAIILIDENMYNKVQQTNSYQRKWVFTASKLAATFQLGDLESLELRFQ